MAYTARDSLASILPGIEFDSITSAADTAIDDADNLINTTLAKRYSVPFGDAFTTTSNIPPMIRTLSRKLASVHLMNRLFSRDSQQNSAWVDATREECMQILMDVRERKTDIINTAGSVLTELGSQTRIDSSNEGYFPYFDEGDPYKWKLDPDYDCDEIQKAKE